MMQDAFGQELSAGMNVIYSVRKPSGTEYVIGSIRRFFPSEKSGFDRLEINPLRSTMVRGNQPITVFAANCVKWSQALPN